MEHNLAPKTGTDKLELGHISMTNPRYLVQVIPQGNFARYKLMGQVIVLLLQPHASFLEPAVFPLQKEKNNQKRILILININE